MAKKKSLSDIETLRKKLHDTGLTLFNESDRGCVLVGAAMLEESLEMLFRAWFKMFPEDIKLLIDSAHMRNINLSTLGSRIEWFKKVKHMTPWIAKDLEIIKNIRDQCAHAYDPFDINDPNIIEQLMNLKGPPEFGTLPEMEEIAQRINVSTEYLLKDPKSRFIMGVLYLNNMFFALYEETSKEDSVILKHLSRYQSHD